MSDDLTAFPSGGHSKIWIRAVMRAFVPIALSTISVVEGAAQETRSPFAPPGRLRIDVTGTFVAWDHIYSVDEEGQGVEEPLGAPLSSNDLTDLFSGVDALESAIQDLTTDGAYAATLGPIQTAVSIDQTRVPIRVELGVFDWLTLGGTVPLVKNFTEITVDYDGSGSNLGVNPAAVAPTVVADYLTSVDSAVVRATAHSSTVCMGMPGSAECMEAEALRDDLTIFSSGIRQAFVASLFFPHFESAEGESLDLLNSDLSGRLVTANLPGLDVIPLPGEALSDKEGFDSFVENQLLLEPFGTAIPLWELGDVELSAVVRLLGNRHETDGSGQLPDVRYEIGGGAMVRLGTGAQGLSSTPFDPGGGDGQTDVEGRAFAAIQGGRWGLWSDVRYGVQLPGNTVRRLGPSNAVLLSPLGRANVEQDPGDYFRFEIAPRYRLSRELTVSFGYHYWSKGEDSYTLLPPEPTGPTFPEPSGNLFLTPDLLAENSDESRHDIGFGLTYQTRDAWALGKTGSPLEARFLLRRAISGAGGNTRKTFRTEIGLSIYPRIWGR